MDKQLLHELIDRYANALFKVNRRINAMTKELLPEGLTVDQFSTLGYLRDRHNVTSSELADIFCVGKSSITAIVNRLVDKELIRRIPDDKDRRFIYLKLSEKGQAVFDEMNGKLVEIMAVIIGHIDRQEALGFIETFEMLGRLMEGDGESLQCSKG
ncbi:MarR family transcriptional regulator [Paenibacillus protaetiae]|uniref:MarR family transcriptional regulator n=1 Tax=Paenibacillus protaetiae TaxID=2509456 RepID=A0A4P6EYQ5_9BACL|nr:MarR family transcriptional regulator [Paenibacillus protaetiae]